MTPQLIADWLVTYLARCLSVQSKEIDVTLSFDCYGLDSKRAATLVSDLSEWLGRELELSVFYDYGSIAELSNYLAPTRE